MEKLKTGILLEVWSCIMERFHKTSQALQDSKITLNRATKLLQGLHDFIQLLKPQFQKFEGRGQILSDCHHYTEQINRRDGVVVRASASQSVDLGFISQVESHQKTFKKMVFTASLLGARHIRDSVENKPASFLVVSLGKALNGMPHSLCGRQMVGPSSLPVVVVQSDKKRQSEKTCKPSMSSYT